MTQGGGVQCHVRLVQRCQVRQPRDRHEVQDAVREHGALRLTGRTGRVEEPCDVVGIHVGNGETTRRACQDLVEVLPCDADRRGTGRGAGAGGMAGVGHDDATLGVADEEAQLVHCQARIARDQSRPGPENREHREQHISAHNADERHSNAGYSPSAAPRRF